MLPGRKGSLLPEPVKIRRRKRPCSGKARSLVFLPPNRRTGTRKTAANAVNEGTVKEERPKFTENFNKSISLSPAFSAAFCKTARYGRRGCPETGRDGVFPETGRGLSGRSTTGSPPFACSVRIPSVVSDYKRGVDPAWRISKTARVIFFRFRESNSFRGI